MMLLEQALLEQHGGLPWYAYAGIGLVIAVLGRTVAKIAADTVKAIQAEEEAEKSLAEAESKSLPDDKNIV